MVRNRLPHRPRGVHPAGAGVSAGGGGGEAKSYFTGEDKIIIAKQRSRTCRDVYKGQI